MKLSFNNILWILSVLAFSGAMTLFTLDAYEAFRTKRHLKEHGIIVESRVIEKYIDKDYRNNKYHHIKATFDRDGQPTTIDKLVNRKLYKKLKLDDTAKLHYLENNLETIDLVENRDRVNTFYWLLVSLVISIITTIGVLYINLVEPLRA